MSTELLAVLMFVCLFVALAMGTPMAFAFGGTALLFAVLFVPNALMTAPSQVFATGWLFIMLTLPMFILMGNLVKHSGIADAVYDAGYKWIGHINGGLAMVTVIICTLFAAIAGEIAPACITMGLLAIPNMRRYGYHKTIAVGSVGAGSALGTLIPPSIPFILYALMAKESIGALFIGGVGPGLILATLYILYIGIACKLNPKLGPPVPVEERFSWSERIKSLTSIWPFLTLMFLVLGVIWLGVATPAEASCFGAAGALFIALIYRRLTWKVLKESLSDTVKLSLMGLWIYTGAKIFISVFSALGCHDIVTASVLAMPGGKWGIIAMMMGTVLILGCIMDEWAIILMVTPLYVPIIVSLGFSKVWFGVILITNIQVAYLSPPFGFMLFWLRGIVPEDVTTGDLYRAHIPFILCQLIGLSLVIIFPQIALFLPTTMMK